MTDSSSVDTAIVGAGPYGLSVAAHARAEGRQVRIYGRPMQSWAEHMPVGMRLKSEPWASHLSDPGGRHTLQAYCRLRDLPYRHGSPVPVQTFIDYGRWFRRQTAPDLHDVRVARISKPGTSFLLELGDGREVRARSVVLATGFLPYPRVPAVLNELPAPCLRHSSEVHDLSGFAARRVAVIGAGQSAIETAVLLADAGAEVTVIARVPALKWNDLPMPAVRPRLQRLRHPDSGLGPGWRNKAWAEAPGWFRRLPAARRAEIVRTTLGPAGAWWLKDRFAEVFDGARLRTGTVVASAKLDADGVRLRLRGDGPDELEVDHVIAATGYEVDVRRLTLLAEPLRSQLRGMHGTSGPPVLDAGFGATVPGLHIVGLAAAATFGPAMRFVFGCGFTARRVARVLPR